MARRATVIENVRKGSANSIVVDAGDWLLNDRNPAVSTRGKTSVQALHLMGYDAVGLGTLDTSKLTVPELRARIAEADFPVLAANVHVSQTGELLAQAYHMLELGEHRVVLLGLTGAGTTDGLVISDPEEAARSWVPRLAEMADIIIVLSHAGPEVDRRIAESLPEIDVIVGARPKTPQATSIDSVLLAYADISSAGNAGKAVGVADLWFDQGGELRDYQWERIILAQEIEEDPAVLEWLQSVPSR